MAYREENIIRPVSHSSFIMLAARTIQTHLAEKSPSDRILYSFLVFVLPAAPVHPPKYGPLHAAKNENHLSPLSGPRSPSALNPLTRRPSHHHPTPPLHLFEAIYYREMASGHYKHNQALREFIVMCVVSLLAFTSFALALMYNRRAVHAANRPPIDDDDNIRRKRASKRKMLRLTPPPSDAFPSASCTNTAALTSGFNTNTNEKHEKIKRKTEAKMKTFRVVVSLECCDLNGNYFNIF